MFDDYFFLYVLVGWLTIILMIILLRMTKVKVWIKTKLKKKGKLLDIGYLKYEGETVSEVFVSGGNSKLPIGRVKKGESKDDNGYVDVLTSNYAESTGKPSYRMCGYVTPEGYIYKKVGRNGKPERIGYTARPSDPDVPTTVGERSWKTLWLVSTLNAYVGKPTAKLPDPDKALKTQPNSMRMNPGKSFVFNDLNEETAEVGDVKPEPEVAPAPEPVAAPIEPVAEPVFSETMPLPEEASTPEEPLLTEEKPEEIVREEAEQPLDEPEETPEPEKPEKSDQEEVKEPEEKGEEAKETPENAEKDDEEEEGKGKKGKRKKKKNHKVQVREPDAICKFTGFHNSYSDILSPECRACAFAILFDRYNKNNDEEYYKSKPYGWFDTALLTSFIYSIVYMTLFTVYTYILNPPFIGDDVFRMLEFMGLYFIM